MNPQFVKSQFMRRIGIAAMLLATSLIGSTASAQKVLRYSDHEPLGGMRTKFIKDVFFAAIEEESQGRLKVEDHWDSTVATGYDALRVAGEGQSADMAVVVPEYKADALPLHQIFKSFPTGPTGDKQVNFFRRVYAEVPEFSAELAKNNVVEVFLATGYPVAFFSNQPLKTLKDIKGEKWRSASFWHKDALQNAGAIPITMPWGEAVFKALQDKTMDGLMVNVDSGYMLNVHTAAPDVLLSKDLWLGHLYIVAMNQETWNDLAPEDKQAVQRAAAIAYKSLGDVMDSSFDAMTKEMKQEGAKLRFLKRRELNAWEKATKYREIQANWMKEQQGKGVKDAGSTMEKVRAILQDSTK